MNLYLQDLQGYLEHGASFDEAMDHLSPMTEVNVENVALLAKMLRHWPSWRDALRKASVTNFQEVFLCKVKLFATCLDNADLQTIKYMSELLAETSVMFPMDVDLSALQTSCGSLLCQNMQMSAFNDMKAAVADLITMQDKGHEAVLLYLESILQKQPTLAPPAEPQPETVASIIQAIPLVVAKFFDYLKLLQSAEGTSAEKLSICPQWLNLWGNVLHIECLGPLANCVAVVEDFLAIPKGDANAKVRELMQIRDGALKLKKALADFTASAKEEGHTIDITLFNEFLTEKENIITTCGANVKTLALASLDKAIKSLKDFLGDHPATWAKSSACSTEKAVFNGAKNSGLTLDPERLEASMKCLQQDSSNIAIT
eukprot:6486582-Amphidinium_carterae.2